MNLYLGIASILLALVGMSYSSITRARHPNNKMWEQYKTSYQKEYNDAENTVRSAMFHMMMDKFFEHNSKYHTGEHSFSMGENEFTDMAPEEFQEGYMGLDSEKDCNNSSMEYQPPSNPEIPDSVDWNEKGYVTQVVNQGRCGACWAFCTIGSLEGQHKRLTGELVKLSEQQLIDCSTKQGNKGCKGGQMCRALEYATDVGGVNSEKAYPYEGVKTDGSCKFKSSEITAKVGGYLEIPYGDEKALQAAVGLLGPVAAGIDGSPQGFRHYKDGVFSDPSCSNTSLSHAVTIIGYGTENGKDYWLVKNSWGKSWGQNGIGKMLRNSNNHCGLASRALFPVSEKNADGTPKLSGPAAS